MAPPELPIEVQEHIVDQFSILFDRETLKSCNLVCRAWSWNARSRFWAVVELNNVRDCIGLLSVLEESARLRTGAGHFVRALQLPKMGFSSSNPMRASMRCELLRSLIRHMPMVECLHVKGFSISSLLYHLHSKDETSNMQDAISSIFSFRRLLIVLCESLNLASMDCFLQFIGAFPSVFSLHLVFLTNQGLSPRFNVASIEDFLISRREGNIRIQDLSLTSCSIPTGQLSELLDTLAAPPFELQLKRLGWTTRGINWEEYLALVPIFQGAKATLESFQCILDADDRWLGHLDPSEHHCLQSLTLAFRFPPNLPCRWDHVPPFLSRITSTSVQTVTFTLYCDDQPFLQAQEFFDWPALNTVLISLHKKCPSMSIDFRLDYRGEDAFPDSEVSGPLWARLAPVLAAHIPVMFQQCKPIPRK